MKSSRLLATLYLISIKEANALLSLVTMHLTDNSMELNIIFLDIDGVICLGRAIDKQCLQNLKSIVDRTAARIVLSSSWRLFPKSRAQIESALQEAKMEPLLGWTGSRGRTRIDEIYYWMKNFDHKTIDDEIQIKKWIVIDDMDLLKLDDQRMNDHFVFTKPDEGITEETVHEAIRLLS